MDSNSTVLLVEDEESDLKHWSDILRKLDYSVLEATDPRLGLRTCREHKVDCVVLDLDMPESGFAFLIELIENHQRPIVPVIVLTRLMNRNVLEMARNNGAHACLIKHRTSAQELHQAIQNAMASVAAMRTSLPPSPQ